MLELRNIVKVYQGGTVNEHCLFDDFNLTIPNEQFVCVIGSNGSGKTSLLNIICGSIPIDEGCVMIGRENITAYMCRTPLDVERLRLAKRRILRALSQERHPADLVLR